GQLATDLVASRYFTGRQGSRDRESSVRHLVSRVVDTITGWVRRERLVASARDVGAFRDELAHLLVHQKAAFNSPVWFNVGVEKPRPQCSACFILGVEDRLDSILALASVEGRIFS